MALIKTIMAHSGIEISYWKITDWRVNQDARAMDIVLTPYISSQSRSDGYEPLRDEVRRIRATDHMDRNGNYIRTDYTDYFSPAALKNAAAEGKTIYNLMYEYVKTHAPEFELAEDN